MIVVQISRNTKFAAPLIKNLLKVMLEGFRISAEGQDIESASEIIVALSIFSQHQSIILQRENIDTLLFDLYTDSDDSDGTCITQWTFLQILKTIVQQGFDVSKLMGAFVTGTVSVLQKYRKKDAAAGNTQGLTHASIALLQMIGSDLLTPATMSQMIKSTLFVLAGQLESPNDDTNNASNASYQGEFNSCNLNILRAISQRCPELFDFDIRKVTQSCNDATDTRGKMSLSDDDLGDDSLNSIPSLEAVREVLYDIIMFTLY